MEQNIAEIRVSYLPSTSKMPGITNSTDALRIFREFIPKETMQLQEHFLAMYLNRANKVLGIYHVSIGGITGTVADIRLILGVALKSAAVSIILSHNHPSGNVKPSSADISLTKRIKEAADLMDINLLDHLILTATEEAFFSFADEGII